MTFNTKLLYVEGLNSNLAKVKIRVMYAGKNRNGSYFTKEVIENKMLPTIYNTPIIGYMKDDNFTDHGDRLIISGNGEIEFETITYAFGMIPESTEITWENYTEDDGVNEHEYLCVTGYIWKRFEDEAKKILQDGSKHSMEITVKSGEWSNELDAYEVKDGEFAGFCAIGVEPCFEGSKIGGVNSFNLNKVALDFSLLKEEINKLSNDIDNKNNGKEVFSLEDEKILDVENTEKFETLETETVEEFEEEAETTENVEIDNVEEVVEEESEEEFTETVEEVQEEESVDYEKLYNDLLVEFNQLTEKTKELEEFQLSVTKEQKEAVLQDFASKLDVEELSNIDIDNLTIEQIEEKCFALIGKKQAQFSKEEKPNKKVTINFNHTKTSSDWLSVLADETRK